MFSAKTKIRLASLAAVAAIASVPAVALAGVVVKSSGPSAATYSVGKKLDDNSSITLRAGDSVTVLTSKGTHVFKGQGTFKVSEKPRANRARFTAITADSNRSRTGAVRSAEGEPVNPNLWYVAVNQTGNVCLYDLNEVTLWRPDTKAAARYLLSSSDGSSDIAFSFDADSSVATFDATKKPLAEGGSYTISGAGSDGATVTFVKLDENYRRADELAEALVEKGCMSQLSQLADSLES